MSQVCASCGIAVAGGSEGCQRLFESIGLREYEDMRFARYHRIVVDVYAMQHPDRYGRSAKSFAAHLTGLCTWLENEQRAPSVNAAVQRWLSGPSPIVKPPRQGATARSRSASWSTPTIRSATGWRWAAGRARHGLRTSRFTISLGLGSPRPLQTARLSDQPTETPTRAVRLLS